MKTMDIRAYFHLAKDDTLAFRQHLEKVYPIIEKLSVLDPLAKDFLLVGDTEAECLKYLVYEGTGILTKAAEAVLETKFKNETIRSAVWQNSEEKDPDKWISVSYAFNSDGMLCSFTIHFNGEHRFSNTQSLISVLDLIAEILRPSVITVTGPFSKSVFPDRHGVNWMLYLPKVFTAQQIPEARSLVPVMSNDKKPVRLGTIVVSVVDELLSDENPEHVKTAHDIEIRMVNEDLLPTFNQLRERPAELGKS
jgi:hypothetical protein